MSLSSELVLDHIADYLGFLSDAPSFWLMLNTSCDHGCHLATQFHLEPNNYEALLIVTGLASYTRFGFAMKPKAWRQFLGGHQFALDDAAIKFDQQQLGLDAYIDGTLPSQRKQQKFYVVRIGKKLQQSPNKIEEQMRLDGRLITTPPRLNLLRITTQSFQRIADPYLWQYAIDNDGENKGSSDKAASPPLQHPPLGGSPPASAEVAIMTAPAKKKHKLNDDDDVLLTDAPDDNEEVRLLYPHLCSALSLDDRFDSTSPSIQKSIVALLTETHRLFSTEFELVIRGYGNKNIHYI
jgi:hypothetical protein